MERSSRSELRAQTSEGSRMIFHRRNTNWSDFNSRCKLKCGDCCPQGCSSDNDEQLEKYWCFEWKLGNLLHSFTFIMVFHIQNNKRSKAPNGNKASDVFLVVTVKLFLWLKTLIDKWRQKKASYCLNTIYGIHVASKAIIAEAVLVNYYSK